VAVFVLAGGAAAGFALVTRGGEREEDPVAFVREYFGVLTEGDCERAVDLLDTDGQPGEPQREAAVGRCQEALASDDSIADAELMSAELVSERDGRATVRVQIREGGQDEPTEPTMIDLIELDDGWRIDVAAATETSPDG
jgi:hypothetical protein